MDDLAQVTVTFDGGTTTVNFAQAALVLQGTTAVYCKKVDFLWQVPAVCSGSM
jgi:condensin-2 complex subunit H2